MLGFASAVVDNVPGLFGCGDGTAKWAASQDGSIIGFMQYLISISKIGHNKNMAYPYIIPYNPIQVKMLLKKLGAPKNHHWVDDLGSHLEVPLVAASQGMYDLTQHPPDAPWTFWTLEFQLSSMLGRFLMAPETSAAPLEKTVFSPLMIAFLVCRNLLFPSWGNLGHYFTYS